MGHFQRSNIIIDESAIRDWFDTGVCCFSILYTHRESHRVLCADCFCDEPLAEQSYYRGVSRHYLHIGYDGVPETCSNCHLIIPSVRTYRICIACEEAAQSFNRYMRTSGDHPYTQPDPTILVISQEDI